MDLQNNWSYDLSVQKVSGLVTELKNVTLKKSTLTDDIARELYEARGQLDARGRNQYSNVTNVTNQKNWTEYLKDCGLQRMTVHRWLECYDPKEQRLLTDEEYQLKQDEKRREEMNIRDANNSRVLQAYKTGVYPKGWNQECQRLYEEKVKEEKARDERIRKIKEEAKKEAEQKEQKEKERNARIEEIENLVNNITEKSITAFNKKLAFKEKIRISHDGKDDPFTDAIIEYLEELEDDNRRIEACFNIIKICKGIAVDLQVRKE